MNALNYLIIIFSLFLFDSNEIPKTPNQFLTAKGHFFSLIVKDTVRVYDDLKKCISFQSLMEKNSAIIVDRSLLVVQKATTDYNDNQFISLVGFPLSFGKADFRKISIPILEYQFRFENANTKSKYIYNTEKQDDGLYVISGYFLEENFKSDPLPTYASHWVETYKDLKDDKNPIFLIESLELLEYDFSNTDPISIFLKYFENETNKYRPKVSWQDTSFTLKFKNFRNKSITIRDSLFAHDTLFVRLLKEGIDYGLLNKTSKSDFHQFATLISEEDALTLMRCDLLQQKCGNSSYTIRKIIDVFYKAKELKKDSLAIICAARIFFDGGIMLHFDNQVLIEQKVAASYLYSKGIFLGDAILGEILTNEVANENSSFTPYYFFDNDTINQQILKQLTIEVSKNQQDALSKITLIEALTNLTNRDTTSVYFVPIREQLDRLKMTLPEYIQNRLNHQATSFIDQFYKEKEILVKNFEIQDVSFGHLSGEIYSWFADATYKHLEFPVKITFIHDYYNRNPCWKLYSQKVNEFKQLFLGNSLLAQEFETGNIKEINLYFHNGSYEFEPNLSSCGSVMPLDIYRKFKDRWSKTVSLSIKFNNDWRYFDLVLFDDSSIMVNSITEDVKLGSYRFEDLKSFSENQDFGPNTHYSFKVIDKDGVLER